MKKALIILLSLIVIAFIGLRAFSIYNANNIMGNQAVFEVYTDLDKSEIDAYFGLEPGTFDPAKQNIVCYLPVEVKGIKPGATGVNFYSYGIDCNREFDPGRHTKYSNTELRGSTFTLMIVNSGTPLMLIDPKDHLSSRSIVAKKEVRVRYTRGKINHIMISANRAYNYCSQ
jgi:hypothetical protein